MVNATPRPHFYPGMTRYPLYLEPVWMGADFAPHRESIPGLSKPERVGIPNTLLRCFYKNAKTKKSTSVFVRFLHFVFRDRFHSVEFERGPQSFKRDISCRGKASSCSASQPNHLFSASSILCKWHISSPHSN